MKSLLIIASLFVIQIAQAEVEQTAASKRRDKITQLLATNPAIILCQPTSLGFSQLEGAYNLKGYGLDVASAVSDLLEACPRFALPENCSKISDAHSTNSFNSDLVSCKMVLVDQLFGP